MSQSGGSGGSSSQSGDKFDRIRDILLGESLDELNHRFDALETRLHSFESSLSGEISGRVDSIEGRLLSRMEEHQASQKALRESLSEQASALRAEVAEIRTQLEAELRSAVDHLDADKLDRAALSRMLVALAAQLEHEDSLSDRGRNSHE